MTAAAIQLQRVSKRFGGVTALEQVSLEIRRGEVHAIVGENGAGKSTLMKLLAGVHVPDAGEIQLDGLSVRLGSPRDARRQGISIVYQELNLFPHRSVTANVFAHREIKHRWGWLDLRAMHQATAHALTGLGLQVTPRTLVGSLSLGEQQLVEIAGALQQQARILILDEPNSALNAAESQRLFAILRQLRARGITLLYVSHRLEEVFALADRISIIRDGRFQGTVVTSETSIPQVIATMIGRQLGPLFPARKPSTVPPTTVLEVCGLGRPPHLGPIDFTAATGEIVGFAGLDGAGVDELFRVLFGLSPATHGQIRVRGKVQPNGSTPAAMAQGWAMIPPSRREQGLLMDRSIARNATLLMLDKLRNRLGLLDHRALLRMAGQSVQRLGVATDRLDACVSHLSGGNQQKVLLAKWLATDPSLLILNDPTRGVDLGAKQEIYELCRQLAGQGMTILMTSSEVEEILGLSDRVLVLSQGKIVEEFARGQATKADLIHAMTRVHGTKMTGPARPVRNTHGST